MIQVLEGAQREGVGARKVAGGLGERFTVAVEIDVLRHLLPCDLLFEKRSQDDGGGAGVFEAFDAVEGIGQRSRSRHQRMGKLQPEILRAEIHRHTFRPGTAGDAPPSIVISGSGTVMPASCWYTA